MVIWFKARTSLFNAVNYAMDNRNSNILVFIKVVFEEMGIIWLSFISDWRGFSLYSTRVNGCSLYPWIVVLNSSYSLLFTWNKK
jgi:hypothetical protein